MIWLALALLLLCCGIVSASETALFSLRRQALYGFRLSEGRWHQRVYRLMRHPHRVLMTVLMANTAVNLAFFTVSFIALRHIRDAPAAVVAAGSAMVPLAVIVFGEMAPKAIALTGAQRFAPPAAALIAMLHGIFRPVQWVLSTVLVEPITRLLAPRAPRTDTVTTDELRLLVEHSAREGVINSTENDMLQAIVALGEVSVREVMTPRVDIRSVSVGAEGAEVLETIKQSGRRRLPVYGRDLDDIRGVIYVRDVYLNADAPISATIRRIHFVPEQVNLMQLLRHFRTNRIQLAIVVDEYGGTAGVVTNEDVVEWIVGELPDSETPRPESTTERIDENTYRVSGDLSARVWADRFAVGEIDRPVDTVAGLILSRLGRLPRVGDSVRIRNLTLTVEAMQRRRIERVLLHRIMNATGGGGGLP